MALQRTFVVFRTANNLRKFSDEAGTHLRTPSGAIMPEPRKSRFGFLGAICSVFAGLFIGFNFSKMIANFLEEKELFVPSDDDDDVD